jgi:hypothetical protein
MLVERRRPAGEHLSSAIDPGAVAVARASLGTAAGPPTSYMAVETSIEGNQPAALHVPRRFG